MRAKAIKLRNLTKGDSFDMLGVKKNASRDEIDEAFRKKGMELHPDMPTGDVDKFQEARDAYEDIIDPEIRVALGLDSFTGPHGMSGMSEA